MSASANATKRLEGWEGRLAAHLQAAQEKPFAWGSHDCALWCALWVKECTGEDHLAGREGYRTARGAARLMKGKGYDSVAGIASAHLPETPVRLARRGDLLLHPSGSLGICAGVRGCFLGEEGSFSEMTRLCVRAWKVG